MRLGVPLVALVGCSEYELGKEPEGGLPTDDTGAVTSSTPTTPTGPTDPPTTPPVTDTPGDTGDTGSTTEIGCYAPEFGYATNPAARLVTTDSTTPVTVTMVLSDTAYQDTLVLDAPEALALMDAWTTAVGTAVVLGPYTVGTELVFAIDVQNTGDHWQSGPSSRNADGVAHVAVTYEGSCSWLIGFEDLYGGGDLDYNDVVFRVEGLLVEQ